MKPNKVLGYVVKIGFFHLSTKHKKDVFSVEVDLKDTSPELRYKIINHCMKLIDMREKIK